MANLAQDDRNDTLRVVGYEVWMLNVALQHLAWAQAHGCEELKNLALECFALHARTLYDFFFCKSKKKDYLRVQDLLGETESLGKPSKFCEHMAKMNNQLAHITRERLGYNRDPNRKEWRLDGILDNLRNAVSRFKELAIVQNLDVDSIPDVVDRIGG